MDKVRMMDIGIFRVHLYPSGGAKVWKIASDGQAWVRIPSGSPAALRVIATAHDRMAMAA